MSRCLSIYFHNLYFYLPRIFYIFPRRFTLDNGPGLTKNRLDSEKSAAARRKQEAVMKLTTRGKYFYLDGKPFFWLGDTAWLLFSRLTTEEAKAYLRNRAEKGFTVIQATLIHSPNYATLDGRRALLNEDFAAPAREGYWEHALELVRYAKKLGLFMALLPAWGGFVRDGQLNEENIPAYIAFLAETFGREENVIWLAGGDVRGSAAPEAFRLIGRALKRLCPDHLVGFHPFGRCSSSFWFGGDDWLDFNMFQSGHRDYNQKNMSAWDDNDVFYGEDNYRYVQEDHRTCPDKPTLDGEPSYELIPHGLHDGTQPYWQAADVRRYAWWSLLSGAAGHTYGDNAIMQFLKPGFAPSFSALENWDEALHDPGSGQMRHAKWLLEKVAFTTGRSAQEFIAGPNGERHAYRAALLTDKALLVYSYEGDVISLNTARLPFERPVFSWFDPVSGALSYAGAATKAEKVDFTLPNRREAVNDWVLVIEEAID